MRQISYATNTNIDMNLAGQHLIRLEGSTHEKSNRPCSRISSVSNDRPVNYKVKISDFHHTKLWNIAFLEDELNAYLKIHFAEKERPIYYWPGQLIKNPERLAEILRPVYISLYKGIQTLHNLRLVRIPEKTFYFAQHNSGNR